MLTHEKKFDFNRGNKGRNILFSFIYVNDNIEVYEGWWQEKILNIFITDFKEKANNFKGWVSFQQIEQRGKDSSGAGENVCRGFRDLMPVLYQGTASAQVSKKW